MSSVTIRAASGSDEVCGAVRCEQDVVVANSTPRTASGVRVMALIRCVLRKVDETANGTKIPAPVPSRRRDFPYGARRSTLDAAQTGGPMAFVTKTKGSLTVTAYGGDAKTLL